MPFDKESFARQLKIARLKKHYDHQQQLADAMGTDVNCIARWESARNVPNLESAYKLAETLGCSIDELVELPAPDQRQALAV